MTTRYPLEWEADIVLSDGSTGHLRPILPEDAERLVAFHGRLSPESIRYRYFAPHPELSPTEVVRLTTVDHDARVALVILIGDRLVAVGRYDRIPSTDLAEVAFLVDDSLQGRGLGSVLLEHLAAIAAGQGVREFEADVLTENYRMIRVFADAGYTATRSYDSGVVHLVFGIEPTAASIAVTHAREHRAEARSVGRLLAPRSVAVIGAGRDPRSLGHVVLTNLQASGFQGPVYPVNPNTDFVSSVRAHPTVDAIADDVDLAVITVPTAAVAEVVAACARKGVRGLVIMSGGFSETGEAGRLAERALVTEARSHGMRVIGPNSLGIMAPAAAVSLNASFFPALPARGRAGFFCQSAALGIAILASVQQRGLALSSFVSAGNRADVSGNDLLQYWEDDPDTDLVLMHLESVGNPRKFARLARRLGRHKPIVAVKSGGAVAARLSGAADPDRAVDALFRQAGVIRVDTLAQLFDVAEVMTSQPLAAGHRIAVVSNAPALGRLATEACAGHGLTVQPLSPATRVALGLVDPPTPEDPDLDGSPALGPPLDNPLLLSGESTAADVQRALATVLADPEVDAVVVVYVPPLHDQADAVAEVLQAVTPETAKPVVATFLSFVPPTRGRVPSFPSPDLAVAALGRAVAYAEWRRRPEGSLPVLTDVDPGAARSVITQALTERPDGGPLLPGEAAALLAAYGISLSPEVRVDSVEAAVRGAAEVGYPVALKATAEPFRHRPELGTVRLDIGSEDELRASYSVMAERLGEVDAGLTVQPMAPVGVPTVVRTAEDPSFGALLSFGVGGVATDLLGDQAFRVLPLTDTDAADLVRSVRAAPLLLGYRGSAPVDVAALELLLLRVARLADDLPEVAGLDLNPVIVSVSGVTVLRATVRITSPRVRLDTGPRRMR